MGVHSPGKRLSRHAANSGTKWTRSHRKGFCLICRAGVVPRTRGCGLSLAWTKGIPPCNRELLDPFFASLQTSYARLCLEWRLYIKDAKIGKKKTRWRRGRTSSELGARTASSPCGFREPRSGSRSFRHDTNKRCLSQSLMIPMLAAPIGSGKLRRRHNSSTNFGGNGGRLFMKRATEPNHTCLRFYLTDRACEVRLSGRSAAVTSTVNGPLSGASLVVRYCYSPRSGAN